MSADKAGCCGAVRAVVLMRRRKGWHGRAIVFNTWWPAIEAGAEAILQTASGCGAFWRRRQMLKHDALYADKAPVSQ
ncbi:hypothetical protein ACLK1T_17615 [Escherichia coli]